MNNRKSLEKEKEFYLAIMNGNIQAVKKMLMPNRSILLNIFKCLPPFKKKQEAVECVKPTDNENYAIACAAQYGHMEIAKLLLTCDGVNPADNNNRAIQLAAFYGHTEIVKLLVTLDGVDATAGDNYPLRSACRQGHVETVKFLLTLTQVDPCIR